MVNIVESQGYVSNYNICFIYEENNNRLICPANSKRSDKNVGYRSLASLLKAFERKGTSATDIKNRITNMDIETLFTLLTENNAKYHKVCTRNRYDKQKADRPKRKNDNDDDISLTNSPGTRATYNAKIFLLSCFFCEKVDVSGNLTEDQTLGLDKRVRDAAKILKDERLLACLSEGDMVAVEACYHKPCLAELYNKALPVSKPKIEESDDAIRDGIALQRLSNILETHQNPWSMFLNFQI